MKAMILAAGRGARMRPLSDATPKPLLAVNGKPLIDWHLEKLAAAGFRDIVINVCYLADAIITHVGDGARYGVNIRYSREATRLETGGGIATAREWLGDDWFALVSADIYSTFDYRQLVPLGQRLRAAHTEIGLVLVPHHQGLIGEYVLTADRVVFAQKDHVATPHYTWASIGVFRAALFATMPQQVPFTLLPHFQSWAAQGLIAGEVFAGLWDNLGTPAEYAALVRRFALK